jgi:hypothetical protein
MSFKIFLRKAETRNKAMTTINMRPRRLAIYAQCSMIVLVLSLSPSRTMAQDGHAHAVTQQVEATLDQQNALVKIVRDSTEPFITNS